MKSLVGLSFLLVSSSFAASHPLDCSFKQDGQEVYHVRGVLNGTQFAVKALNDRMRPNGEPSVYEKLDLTDAPMVTLLTEAKSQVIALGFGDNPNWFHQYAVTLPLNLKAGKSVKASIQYDYLDEYEGEDHNSAEGICAVR